MTSSYQDPNIYAALAAQKAYEEKKEPTALDLIGGLALGAGIGALAGRGIIRGLRRNAVKPVTVQDLGSVASQAEDTVRAAASAPRPSRPSPGPTATRQQQAEEVIRQARPERPQGVRQVDLSSIDLNEEEYRSPYRKEPTYRDVYPSTFAYERLSPEAIQARRQLNAERALNRQLARPATYQFELGGDISPTLRSLRSSEFGPNITETRREALGLFPDISSLIEGAPPEDISSVSISTSRPISAAPKQFNLFDYLEERGYKESSSTGVPYNETQSIATAKAPAVESGGDAADRLILEFQQLSERQARADQRARASVREYQMRLQGTADRVLEDLRNESLVEIQQANQPFNVDQAINALESGEDQMTGRVRQQLQRNEDLNLNQIDALEDTTGSIDAVASQTTDGLPVDQIETARPLSSQELADLAKEEMISLRQQVAARGLRPGTQRFENALAQAWVDKSIPGATPGTQKFQELQSQGKINISLPSTIRKAVEAESAGAGPTGFLPERTLINIGLGAQIESTAAGTAIRGVSPSSQEVPLKEELRQLYGAKDPLVFDVPSEMGEDIPYPMRARGAMSTDIPESEQSKQEIVYSFLNRPPTPQIPGGAAGTGIYGIEPAYVPGAMSKVTGQYSAAAERKPTSVPKWILKKEATPFSNISTEGLLRAQEKSTKTGALAIQSEIERRQRVQESIAVSEVLRRARIEGRDPQEFLRRQLGGSI